MEQKLFLLGRTLDELQTVVKELGMPAFTARQIATWLYGKKVGSIDEMTDISLKNRQLLKERYEVGAEAPVDYQRSVDGTVKYLYPVGEGHYVESVFIPDADRATLCVSSQVGCKMNCRFCMTGKQGFTANLTARQIINQIHSLPERERLTNVVMMGMGEPLDNLDEVLTALHILTAPYGYGWSPKRITLSTVGIRKGLRRFVEECDCHLAVSLHSPLPLQVNDSLAHARELLKLLRGLDCRINLIRFHAIPGVDLQGTDMDAMLVFRDYLTSHGLFSTIRASRGEDIFAACGMLSTSKAGERKGESV